MKEPMKVVTLGDSVTWGASATEREKCWANRVVTMLNEFCNEKFQLVNKGIGSNILSIDTPAYPYASKPVGLERIKEDVVAEKPDILIIGYGLNDSRGGTNPRIFRRDYQRMIDEIRESCNPLIVSLNLYYMHEEFYHSCENWNYSDYDLTEEYNLIIRQLAIKNNLIYADVYAVQSGLEQAVCEDHCHPNDLGHFIIANKIFEAIVRSQEFWKLLG